MNFAYVTFLIKNDSYVPGALVFAYSLKKQNTKMDLICFVSNDISKTAITSLKVIYDKVIFTDQIEVENKRKQQRQDVKLLFNRFNALLLENEDVAGKAYDKIIIADCDVLAIKKWDSLFEVNAPAGIINESKEHTMQYEQGKYVIPDSYYQTTEWVWHDIYKNYPHGAKLPKTITDKVNKDNNNMGINAGLYLLKPSIKLYNSILSDLKDEHIKQKINNYNWPEMQYITQKLSGKWHNIDLKFASISGYPTLHHINGIHFVGLKPWSFKNKSLKTFARFDDFKLWYATYKNMLKDYPALAKNTKLNNLLNKINKLQQNKKYFFDKHDIENIKHLVN
jgi:glycogenin glucosyltransferase